MTQAKDFLSKYNYMHEKSVQLGEKHKERH